MSSEIFIALLGLGASIVTTILMNLPGLLGIKRQADKDVKSIEQADTTIAEQIQKMALELVGYYKTQADNAVQREQKKDAELQACRKALERCRKGFAP